MAEAWEVGARTRLRAKSVPAGSEEYDSDHIPDNLSAIRFGTKMRSTLKLRVDTEVPMSRSHRFSLIAFFAIFPMHSFAIDLDTDFIVERASMQCEEKRSFSDIMKGSTLVDLNQDGQFDWIVNYEIVCSIDSLCGSGGCLNEFIIMGNTPRVIFSEQIYAFETHFSENSLLVAIKIHGSNCGRPGDYCEKTYQIVGDRFVEIVRQ